MKWSTGSEQTLTRQSVVFLPGWNSSINYHFRAVLFKPLKNLHETANIQANLNDYFEQVPLRHHRNILYSSRQNALLLPPIIMQFFFEELLPSIIKSIFWFNRCKQSVVNNSAMPGTLNHFPSFFYSLLLYGTNVHFLACNWQDGALSPTKDKYSAEPTLRSNLPTSPGFFHT